MTADILKQYRLWIENADSKTCQELNSIRGDNAEIEDRFYKDIEFGTAGMRGVMGAGTNRINKYTVKRASRGLADWIIWKGDENPSVAIAYDTRANSQKYAMEAAKALASCGIKTFVFDTYSATPLLSFAVRELNCSAGIVITASHNTKEYNGFKVYDETGCQMVSREADHLTEFVEKAPLFDVTISEEEGRQQGLIVDIGNDIVNDFCKEVISLHKGSVGKNTSVKIAYTPLHGTGTEPVMKVLSNLNYDVTLVAEQTENIDGAFFTVEKPNPEEERALELAIRVATEKQCDIVIGTDPDCDRIGVAVRNDDNRFQVLTGNQIGALLVNYIITERKDLLGKNPVMVKSVVTDNLGVEIAKKSGV